MTAPVVTTAAQGAVLRTCALEGEDAVVLVEVRPAGGPGRLGGAQVRARAGPAEVGR